MRTLLALTALTVALLPAQHDHDDEHPKDFKGVLQALLRASRENLVPLKTVRIEMRPGRTYWYEVEITLPGARQCRIYEHPRPVYRCELPGSAYANLVKDVASVLGSEQWKQVAVAQSARFEPANPRRDALLEVRVKGAKAAAVVEFLLYGVDRDGIYQ